MNASTEHTGGRTTNSGGAMLGAKVFGRHAVAAAAVGVLVLLGACTSTGSASPPVSATTTGAASSAATLEAKQDLVVNSHHFTAQCTGHGPSVLLVSGYGAPMDYWADVPTRLAATARTCMYDRLGIGNSDSPPPVQTFEDIASDLDGVITALRLPRPIVVVAHSLGGPIAVTWAAHHQPDARALVLLDIVPPGWHAAQASLTPPPDPGDLELTAKIADDRRFDDPLTNLESLDPASWTTYDHIKGLDVPLSVLVAGMPPRLPAALDAAKFTATWNAGQRRLAGLSRDGHLVTAEDSDHLIWLWRLDLVLATVTDALTS